MPNEMNILRPILIGGPGRSGTTWVQEMLSQDPSVQAVIENSLAYTTYQQLCASWWSEIFRNVECGGDNEVQSKKAAEVIRTMLCDLFPSQRPHWCMKIIWGVESTLGVPLDFWRRLFPQARYVHCTRNPLTCIPSILRYLGNYPGLSTAGEAEASMNRGHRDMLKLKASGVPYIKIPLEEVTREPAQILRELQAFCGLEALQVPEETVRSRPAASQPDTDGSRVPTGDGLRWSDLTQATAELAAEIGYEIPAGITFRETNDAQQAPNRQELQSRVEQLATENNELKIKLDQFMHAR